MVSSKVPHPIHTKTSLLIGINVSEKKLSLLELDSRLSIDAAIIRHSLWFKALDHNPCEQISGAWQCPVNSVSWLDNLAQTQHLILCVTLMLHDFCSVVFFLSRVSGSLGLYLFIILGYWWNIMWSAARATCQFSLCIQQWNYCKLEWKLV